MENALKVSSLSQGALWFGAAVSLAEILTGALIAPLGFWKGFAAIVLGHLIGTAVLYFTGFIGARSRLSAIESTRISFGKYGSWVFSVLNMIQLLGWTAVMIASGASAMDGVTQSAFGFGNTTLWCALIAAFIGIWVLLGSRHLSRINGIAVGALFLFTLVLGFIVFRGAGAASGIVEGSISFGGAVELSAIMPLSWLPLISDYTRHVRHEKRGTLCSAWGYFAGSTFMYVIGLGAALYAGTSDISAILVSAGLGSMALIIIVLSTVTTTFLDAYSAGVSSANLHPKINEKTAALGICILGAVIAVTVPFSQYESFLYLIGSVFAPLFAIVLTDYFILKNQTVDAACLLNVKNICIWLAGVAGYRMLMSYDSPVGITLPVMLAIGMLCIITQGGKKTCSQEL